MSMSMSMSMSRKVALIGASGKFRLGQDVVVKDAEGNSRISYDDYAIAMVDELKAGRQLQRRFTVGY